MEGIGQVEIDVSADFVEVTVHSRRINEAIITLVKAVNALGAQFATLSTRTDDNEVRIDKLVTDMKGLQSRLDDTTATDSLRAVLEHTNKQVSDLKGDVVSAKEKLTHLGGRVERQEERKIPDIAPLVNDVAGMKHDMRQHKDTVGIVETQTQRLRELARELEQKVGTSVRALEKNEANVASLYNIFEMKSEDVASCLKRATRHKSESGPSPQTEFLLELPVFNLLNTTKAAETRVDEVVADLTAQTQEGLKELDDKILKALQRIVAKVDKEAFEDFASEIRGKMRDAEELVSDLHRLRNQVSLKAEQAYVEEITQRLFSLKADRGDLLKHLTQDELEPLIKDIAWLRDKLNELSTSVDLQFRQVQKTSLESRRRSSSVGQEDKELEKIRRKLDQLHKVDLHLEEVKADRHEWADVRNYIDGLVDELGSLREHLRAEPWREAIDQAFASGKEPLGTPSARREGNLGQEWDEEARSPARATSPHSDGPLGSGGVLHGEHARSPATSSSAQKAYVSGRWRPGSASVAVDSARADERDPLGPSALPLRPHSASSLRPRPSTAGGSGASMHESSALSRPRSAGIGSIGRRQSAPAELAELVRPDGTFQTQSAGTIIQMQYIPAGVRMGRPARLLSSEGVVTNATVTPRVNLEHYHTSPRRSLSPV